MTTARNESGPTGGHSLHGVVFPELTPWAKSLGFPVHSCRLKRGARRNAGHRSNPLILQRMQPFNPDGVVGLYTVTRYCKVPVLDVNRTSPDIFVC